MKYSFCFLFCISCSIILSQSSVKIEFAEKDLLFNDIAGLSVFGNLGATPGSKIIGINCQNLLTNQNEIFLCPFSTAVDIRTAFMIFHKEGSLFINKMIRTGIDDVSFIGTYSQTGATHLMVFGNFNVKLKALTSLKMITSVIDPGMVLKPVDILYHNFNFYILAETLVNFLNEFNSKIVIIKTDGRSVLWSNSYNTTAAIHSEIPRSIALTPNQHIAIGGLIIRATDKSPRMMLAQIDLDGNPMMMKSVELMSADMRTNHKFNWTLVGSKGVNIHLFSQAIDNLSEPGTVLVTMFDNELNLRTWRNYTADIRVETANLDGNFFMFSGQAPVEKSKQGFMLMKVNSANAIVEQFKFFEDEIKYQSPISSSAIGYDRAVDFVWTIVKPNETSYNHLILLGANSGLDHKCGENYTTTVAKDPMLLTEIAFSAKTDQMQLSTLDGQIREIEINTTELCYTTGSEEHQKNKVMIYPNPAKGQFTLKSDQSIENIQILDLDGKLVSTQLINSGMGKTYIEFKGRCIFCKAVLSGKVLRNT